MIGFKVASLVALLLCVVGCESTPQKNVEEMPESESPRPQPEPEQKPAASSQPKPVAELVPFPSKDLEYFPLMEEYHSLTVTWNGTGETSRTLHADHKVEAEAVGTLSIDKDTIESSSGVFMQVTKPREFTTTQALSVDVEVDGVNTPVKLEPGDSMYLYAYQGEGMCDVGYRDADGKPVLGVSICPGMGEGDWTTAPGDERLAEGLDWWFESKNKAGEQGWVRLDISELKLILTMDDD